MSICNNKNQNDDKNETDNKNQEDDKKIVENIAEPRNTTARRRLRRVSR